MSTIAITVEGVLRKPVGGQPIPVGFDLYYGLATRAKLVLLTDSFNEKDDLYVSELAHWLRVEGLMEHAAVFWNSKMYGQEPHNADIRRVCMANEARRSGHDVDLVVEPDPDVCATLLHNGYSTLLFTHAQYAMPAWRPDYEHTVQPWEELSAQVAHEAFLRAEDKRKGEAQ